jgi:hypothetical protein
MSKFGKRLIKSVKNARKTVKPSRNKIISSLRRSLSESNYLVKDVAMSGLKVGDTLRIRLPNDYMTKDNVNEGVIKNKTRKLTLYRDDSTVQVIFENVKHFFWTANNSVLVIAQITDITNGAHKYIHWPRERFCWFKDEKE